MADHSNAVLDKSGNRPYNRNHLNTGPAREIRYPVAVMSIQADAGLDIGLTLIGMHLRRVAIPLRLNNRHIGSAIVAAARTRPMLIGGERAIYEEEK